MVRAHAVLDAQGGVAMVVNAFQDLTAMMQREQQLEEANVRLEDVATELEQTIEELQEQKAEAQEAMWRAELERDRNAFIAEAGRILAS